MAMHAARLGIVYSCLYLGVNDFAVKRGACGRDARIRVSVNSKCYESRHSPHMVHALGGALPLPEAAG